MQARTDGRGTMPVPAPRAFRVLARAIDVALLAVVTAVLWGEVVTRMFPGPPARDNVYDALLAGDGRFRVLALAVSAAIEVVPVAVVGASPGKLVLGLRVRLEDRPERPGPGRSVARWLPVAAAVTVPVVGVPLFVVVGGWALVDRAGQGLHDRLAATVVVEHGGGAARRRASPPS